MGGISNQIAQVAQVAQQAQAPGGLGPNPYPNIPLNDPLNRGGLPFQGNTGPKPFVSPRSPSPIQGQPSPYNPLPIQNLQNMLQGMPQGGFNPQMPPQQALPTDYQSPYANYGFDSGLQSYLDNQYIGSMRDGGTAFNYDPTTQSFTGLTRGGRYNAIPLSVMQQAASGTGPGLYSYYQSSLPQPPMPNPMPLPGQPTPFPGFGGNTTVGNPRRDGFNRIPPVVQPGPNVFPQPQPQDSKRGLGGLQLDKFRNRLR